MTNVPQIMKCNVGCIPNPELFSGIYGVVKQDGEDKLRQMLRTIPEDTLLKMVQKGANGGAQQSKGGVILVMVLFMCMVLSMIAAGTIYYYQDEVAKLLGYKNGADMFGTGTTDTTP